jgi:hypothetical protein
MEYKPVEAVNLVVGQRFYIVPKSRLVSNKLVTIVSSTIRYQRFEIKPIPDTKKNTIFLLSAVLTSKSDGWYTSFTFDNFWNKDNAPSKDTRKSTEEYVYFSFTPTPAPTVMGSTVTSKEAKATIGELAENVLPASMRPVEKPEAGAGAGSALVAPELPEIRTAMTPAIKKTTDELIATLRLGEARVSVSDILKRKNTPQLENLVNRLLYRTHAIQILPSDYPIPPGDYYGPKHVNVYSPYGAIELLIESQRFTHEQKERYIREMVHMGADPSKALVTAILYSDLHCLNVLLDLGADPNYVSEYKSTDEKQRFLTSPLLVAIPARFAETNNNWAHIQPILQTLIQHRTFVLNAEGELTRMERNSLPDGTLVYETVAFITPKILDTFNLRLQDHIRATAEKKARFVGRNFISEARYTEVVQRWIHYLEEESEKQGALLAEPGGLAYEEARARAYGPALGTRNEQLARNAAANMTMRHTAEGGSRKRRTTHRRRQTRHK